MNNNQKTKRTSRRVQVTNPDMTTTTYRSISQAAKALGKHAAQICPRTKEIEIACAEIVL